ncbi:PP2C family protein-serine/threonine phosphatase [Allokutzneria albata]|uniref:Serine phosphatase RsbU, regulator of sigma subunit n=1 Tax=Allokutzneria albata TaxID=211114 RepID=A0A1G9VLP6_ALLAB|nr:PP2C family protein-serine/threonine phosphatase [Allokutzneria albata]SDM73030.1 Serine phosphatase RsbU, regulator of sigma subunit [Allokutzneria albata]
MIPARPKGAMTETRASTTPRTDTAPRRHELLAGSGEAVVLCDRHGTVLTVDGRVELLPDIGPGAVIGARAGTGTLRWRRHDLPDGRHLWYVRDVAEETERTDALLAERVRSGFLASASRRLGLSLHPARTARAVVDLAVPKLGDSAMVLAPPSAGRVPWWRDGSAGWVQQSRLPEPVADAMAGLGTHCSPWVVEELTDAGWLWPAEQRPVSALVISLPGNGNPAGVLVLTRSTEFTDEDLALIEEFCSRAGIALAGAALYADQVHTASTLQRSLLPAPLPHVEGMSFGAAYRASREALRIGGDFYEVLPLPDGSALFALGDVCGKGVEAAVLTGEVRQSLRALSRLERDPLRLLTLLNETMLDGKPMPDRRFVTMVLGRAAPAPGGELELTLAVGGHLPPLLLRGEAGVEPVDLRGTLIGVFPDARFAGGVVRLRPGETCVLYSDGVTEAKGSRGMFGERRLADALTGCAVMPAGAVAERVELLTTQWLAGRDHDDIAVLAVRAHPVRETAC